MNSLTYNTTINNSLFSALYKRPPQKIFFADTVASYPFPFRSLTLKEEDFFNGNPHYGEFGYSMAKKHAYSYLKILQKELGISFVYGLFTNLFGEHDKFDIHYGHVIPSLIAKAYQDRINNQQLEVWGDGSAERDFIYSKDAAQAILFLLNHHDSLNDIIKQKRLLYLYTPLQRYFLNSVSKIVATSPNYLVSSDILQKYSNKVSVIPIGIDHTKYQNPDPERLNYWRMRFQKPFFLFMGAMRYYKGLHILLQAIAHTNINVVIAGVNHMENELKAQASDLRLDNVDFLGVVDEKDKVALLHLCYGFVFPSHLRSEAFGISLLEAASVGKPMISCEIGTGTSFVNIANETGLVVNPSIASDLRESMLFLLHNPDIAKKMGENGKKRSYKLFTAEKMALSYVKLYNISIKN